MILYMLSMRPSGEKHVDIDFLDFYSYIFYRQDTLKRCPAGFFHLKSMSSYLI